MRYYYVLSLLLIPALFAAQAAESSIQGQITPISGILPESLSVEIVSEGRPIDRIDPGRDGTFTFHRLPAGQYQLRIMTRHGDVLRSEFITVGSHTAHLEFRIAGIEQRRPPSGSVSLRALAKPAPKNAVKELQRSQSAFAKGNKQAAVDHVNKALEICGDCPEVLNGLGVLAMRVGQIEKAAAAFEKVAELDPQSATAHANLALAFVTLRQYDQAQAPARKAYELDRGQTPARYALGLVALGKRECTDDALRHLEAASELYPRAHLSVAAMLECRGERQRLISTLTAYLERPDSEQRDDVMKWLAKLKQ